VCPPHLGSPPGCKPGALSQRGHLHKEATHYILLKERANFYPVGLVALVVSAVHILEPDNIVLVEITSGLDFNQESRDLSRVGEAMFLAEWNVG
jgi:hypothetical protein